MREATLRAVFYSLEVKALDGTVVRPKDPNPAMLQRPDLIHLDAGREWAGDLYDTGAPTDPETAFARFTGDPVDTETGPEDVEAWVDRTEDGTLTGWVRQGSRVWRYTDPTAWALDVDGAQMKRAGGDAPKKNTDDNPDDDADDVVEASVAEDDEHAFGKPAKPKGEPKPEEPKTEVKTLRLVVRPKA